jgi:hypothetical protein
MKYIIYEGNPRVEKAKKLAEFNNLDDALNRVAIEKNNGKDAYVQEESEQHE